MSALEDGIFNAYRGLRVVVTGGAGFIGSHLADTCIRHGAEVTIIDDLSCGDRNNVNPAARLIVGDIRDSVTMAQVTRDAAIVFHLAGQINPVKACVDPLFDCSVNVMGTLNVLIESRRAGVQRVVLASTNLYGNSSPESAKLEGSATLDDHLAFLSPYASAKAALEAYAMVFQSLGGLETVRMRFANVFGTRQNDLHGSGVIAIYCRAALEDRPMIVFGTGKQTRDFVHVSDVVSALLRSGVHPNAAGKVFNVASGVETSIQELAALVSKLSNCNCEILAGPERVADFGLARIDIHRIRDQLSWNPERKLEVGLREYLDWLRASKLSPVARRGSGENSSKK